MTETAEGVAGECAKTLFQCAARRQVTAMAAKFLGEVEKAPLYADRARLLAAAKQTAPFWQAALGGNAALLEAAGGDYDAEIVAALRDVTGAVATAPAPGGTDVGLCRTLELHFAPNDFFSDAVLWMKETYLGPAERVYETSGVHWKAGFGPYSPSEQAAFEAADKEETRKAQALPVAERFQRGEAAKRERVTRGPSLFQEFERPAAGEATDESSSDDDDSESADDRREEVFLDLWENLWANPMQHFATSAA